MRHIFLTLAWLIIALQACAQNTPKETNTENKGVQWLTIEDAYAQSKINPKPIFIDVYTDWCGWCKRMDANTFSNPVIAELLNKHFYAVKFNAEQKEEINILDNTFKFVAQGQRGYHELAAALLQGKMSYPTTVFLAADFSMIQPVPGYQDAKGFESIVSYFSGDAYQTTTWEDFQKTFVGKVE
jgi:thioredoxin-related protein